MSGLDTIEDTREHLLMQVREEPGLTKTELCKRVGLAWGTVYYHVNRLQKAGIVNVIEDGSSTRVFDACIPSEDMRLIGSLRREYSKNIVRFLSQNGGIQMCDLVKDLGVSRKIVRRHLSALSESGALQRGEGSRPRYWATLKALRLLKRL